MKLTFASALQLTSQQRQAMIMVIGLLVLMAVSIVTSIASLFDQLNERSASQATLRQFETRIARQPETTKLLKLKPEDYRLPVTSASLAAADLQKRMSTAFAANGGTVLSTEIIPNDASDSPPRVGLSVGFIIDEAALQAALYIIETARPAIAIDGVTLRPMPQPDAATTAPKLQGNLSVSALWMSDRP